MLSKKPGKLCIYGYKIKKCDYPDEVLRKVRQDLNLLPAGEEPGPNAIPIQMFYHKADCMYLPRYYGIKMFGEPKESLIDDTALPLSCKYNKKEFPLMKRQIEILNDALPKIHTNGGGILNCGAGAGKTKMSIYISIKFGLLTLIIVPRINLIPQWTDEIHVSTRAPQGKVHHLEGADGWQHVPDDTDYIICTMQTFSKHKYPIEFLKKIGMIIYDEVQYVPTRKYSACFLKCCPKYIIGLSATSLRVDRLDVAITHYCGGSLYSDSFQHPNDIRVLIVQLAKSIKQEGSEYGRIHQRMYKGKPAPNHSRMLEDIVYNTKRNDLIIEWVEKMATEIKVRTTGREGNLLIHPVKYKILVVSNRVNHLKQLQSLLCKKNDRITSGLIIGEMKEEEILRTKEQQVLFGNISICRDGLSISDLDAIMITTSIKNVLVTDEFGQESEQLRQVFGRVLRRSHKDRPVQICYIGDTYGQFQSHTKSFIDYCNRNPLVKSYIRNLTHHSQKIPTYSANLDGFIMLTHPVDSDEESDTSRTFDD